MFASRQLAEDGLERTFALNPEAVPEVVPDDHRPQDVGARLGRQAPELSNKDHIAAPVTAESLACHPLPQPGDSLPEKLTIPKVPEMPGSS